MRGWALGGFVAFGVVLLLCAPNARAQDAATSLAPGLTRPWGPRLSYSTTAGCLDEETFHHAVAFFHRGADPFDPNAADELRVKFMKVRGGYRSIVQKIPAQGAPWPEEESTGATCAEVFQDTARLASMRVPDRPKPAPAPVAEPAPTDLVPPPEPPVPPPDPIASKAPSPAPVSPEPFPPASRTKESTRPMDLTITLSAAALLTAGFTADVGPGIQIGAGLRRDWFSIDLEVRGVFPSAAWARAPILPDKPTNPQHFDLSQLSAQLVPCVRFATYFAGCGVVGVYTLIAHNSLATVFPLGFSIGPRFGGELPLGDTFALFGFAEALFAPGQPFVGYRDPSAPGKDDAANVVWRQSLVSGFFGAGVSVKFP